MVCLRHRRHNHVQSYVHGLFIPVPLAKCQNQHEPEKTITPTGEYVNIFFIREIFETIEELVVYCVGF